MPTRYPRANFYLTPAVIALRKRAMVAGDSASQELSLLVERYEHVLSIAARGALDDDSLAVFRRLIAIDDRRMPLHELNAHTLALKIEGMANPKTDSDDRLRQVYALSRKIDKLQDVQCIALVELAERWARRRHSQANDPIDKDHQ